MAVKRNQEPSKQKLLKIPAEVFKLIQEKADLYTGGNTSMWIKYAAINHEPHASELRSS